jgi:hypothetical protein
MAPRYEDEKLYLDLEEAEEELSEQGSGGCQTCFGFCAFAERHSVSTILLFAAIGICVGVGISYWEPTNSDTKTVVIQWIGLIGDLFLRALKCTVLPVRCQSVSIFDQLKDIPVHNQTFALTYLYFFSSSPLLPISSFSSAGLRQYHRLCR